MSPHRRDRGVAQATNLYWVVRRSATNQPDEAAETLAPLRVVVIDPAPLWRRGLALVVQGDPALQLVESADVAASLRTSHVDVAMLHLGDALRPPTEASVDAWLEDARHLRSRFGDVRLVGIRSDLSAAQEAAANAGLNVLIDRASSAVVLLRAVKDPSARTLLPWSPPSIGPVPLTRRECDVLRLVAQGMTSRESAAALGMSHRTVENHKQRIFARLGVQSQAQAVAMAIRFDLLPHQRATA